MQEFKYDDLIKDPSFIKWVKNPDPLTENIWQEWLVQNPDKQKDVEEARKFVRLMHFKNDIPFPQDYDEVWCRIQKSTREAKKGNNNTQKIKRFSGKYKTGKIAASLTGILILSVFLYFSYGYFNLLKHQTTYGQTNTVQLPDGSVVTLNANSTLKYYEGLSTNSPFKLVSGWFSGSSLSREVWLEGEAYFKIKEITNQSLQKEGQKGNFIVHTDNLDVEVLGTQFNVNNRRGKTQVVLSEGKILLKGKMAFLNNNQLFMQPGELVEVSKKEEQIVQKKVDPENYSAWRENKMVFDDASLEEIALRIEDNFGYEVHIKDPQLKKRTFTMTKTENKLSILLKLLEESMVGIEITIKQNKILIQKKSNPGPSST